MKRFLALMTIMAAVVTTPVGAIVVVPITFEQLVDEAAAVVYARVADVRGQWTFDRQSIDSIVTLEALQYVKGDLGSTVAMRLPGGEAGGRIQVIPGAPTLRAGELVVLFLKARGPALLTPLGLGQGIFRVARDARTGALLVTPPPLKESQVGRIIRGAAERRALSVDAFFAAVRDTARGAGGEYREQPKKKPPPP
jgi:hypothetical protein